MLLHISDHPVFCIGKELEGLQTNALVSHDESTKHVKTDDWKTTRQDDPGSNIAHFVLRHNDPNTNCLL